MPLNNITDVFPNATVTSNSFTVPFSDLANYNQGNDVTEGAELIYSLLVKMNSVVAAAGHDSLTSSVTNSFNAAGLTMTRTFTFGNILDLSGDVDNFNVKQDPDDITLTLTADNSSGGTYDHNTDDATTALATVSLSKNGTAVLPDSSNAGDFTLAATSDVGGTFEVADVSNVWTVRCTDDTGLADGAHTITVTVDDTNLAYDAVTATFSLTVSNAP
jgi:hypothetical protein